MNWSRDRGDRKADLRDEPEDMAQRGVGSPKTVRKLTVHYVNY